MVYGFIVVVMQSVSECEWHARFACRMKGIWSLLLLAGMQQLAASMREFAVQPPPLYPRLSKRGGGWGILPCHRRSLFPCHLRRLRQWKKMTEEEKSPFCCLI